MLKHTWFMHTPKHTCSKTLPLRYLYDVRLIGDLHGVRDVVQRRHQGPTRPQLPLGSNLSVRQLVQFVHARAHVRAFQESLPKPKSGEKGGGGVGGGGRASVPR